eukprot:14160122-Alexandrium_andersonii.AAC.1
MEDGRVLAIRHAIGAHGHLAALHAAIQKGPLHWRQQSRKTAPRVLKSPTVAGSALTEEQQPTPGEEAVARAGAGFTGV